MINHSKWGHVQIRGCGHPILVTLSVLLWFIWRYMAPAILFGRSADVKMTMLRENDRCLMMNRSFFNRLLTKLMINWTWECCNNQVFSILLPFMAGRHLSKTLSALVFWSKDKNGVKRISFDDQSRINYTKISIDDCRTVTSIV